MRYKLIPYRDKIYKGVEIIVFPDTNKEQELTVATLDLYSVLVKIINESEDNSDAHQLNNGIACYVDQEVLFQSEGALRGFVEETITKIEQRQKEQN